MASGGCPNSLAGPLVDDGFGAGQQTSLVPLLPPVSAKPVSLLVGASPLPRSPGAPSPRLHGGASWSTGSARLAVACPGRPPLCRRSIIRSSPPAVAESPPDRARPFRPEAARGQPPKHFPGRSLVELSCAGADLAACAPGAGYREPGRARGPGAPPNDMWPPLGRGWPWPAGPFPALSIRAAAHGGRR